MYTVILQVCIYKTKVAKIQAIITFYYVTVFVHVAWPMAWLFHYLCIGVYSDSTRKTSKRVLFIDHTESWGMYRILILLLYLLSCSHG